MPLFPRVEARTVITPRLASNVLTRTGQDDSAPAIVFLHGNVSSSLFWQETMLAVPDEYSVWAIDLRGYGDSEPRPVDSTRGLRDFTEDVAGVIGVLGLGAVHLVGWSMGGGIALQYALGHPVRSITLQSPVSPYGFGGTRLDGTRLTDDDAGTGGGSANTEFVANLAAGDTGEGELTARGVFRSAYVAEGYSSAYEDTWVASMLSTVTGVDNHPGDAAASAHWPGFAAGTRGVLNAMSPKHLDLTGIVDLAAKPPVLWVRGDRDAIVSDTSFFDLNYLGQLGVIPGWPGAEAAPAQPMVSQTRAVLDRYAANGGSYREVVFEGAGHSPHLEDPARFTAELLRHVSAAG
ncbi:MAG: alpha/beta hydrolase [Schumannella sp.]|nr:alpha/beta hydrolase [Schumannella sp.]